MTNKVILDFGSLKTKYYIFEKDILIQKETFINNFLDNINNELLDINYINEHFKTIKNFLKDYKPDKIKALGKEALRNINNLDEFNDILYSVLNISSVSIIDQKIEGDLFF